HRGLDPSARLAVGEAGFGRERGDGCVGAAGFFAVGVARFVVAAAFFGTDFFEGPAALFVGTAAFFGTDFFDGTAAFFGADFFGASASFFGAVVARFAVDVVVLEVALAAFSPARGEVVRLPEPEVPVSPRVEP